MPNTIVIHDEDRTGIDILDTTRVQFRGVTKRLLDLTSGGVRGKFAYDEGIRYLEGYVSQFFDAEEAYMREKQFPNYLAHKKLHDTMRNKTLPALKEKIKLFEYSPEVIEEFLGFYMGWLRCHIMIEDRMIAGKIPVTSFIKGASVYEQLERAMPLVSEEMFREKSELVHDRYIGDHFGNEATDHYKLTFQAPNQDTIRVCFSMEERMIRAEMKKLLNFDKEVSKRSLRAAVKMYVQAMVHRLCAYVDLGNAHYPKVSYSLIKQPEALSIYDDTIKLYQQGKVAHNILISTATGNFSASLSWLETESA